MLLAAGTRLGPYEIVVHPLVRAAWGRSIEHATRASTAPSRSRSLPTRRSRANQERFAREAKAICGPDASAHLHRSTTSAIRTGSTFW